MGVSAAGGIGSQVLLLLLLLLLPAYLWPRALLQSGVWSRLTFKSLSHFEYIFVYGVKECSNFIDLHAAVQLSKHHL